MKKFEQFKAESALSGANAAYVEDLFETYLADANAVSPEWQKYFAQFKEAGRIEVAHGPIRASFAHLETTQHRHKTAFDHVASEKQAAVLRLISAYRIRGHQHADLCPVNLRLRNQIAELSPEFHGLTAADLEAEFNSGTLTRMPRMQLKQIIEVLQRTYTRHVGAEFMHITNTEERNWIQNNLESVSNNIQFHHEDQKKLLKQLIAAEGLEQYLHTRYVGQKRFSLEGGDTLIPMMHALIERASEHGAQEVVIGMAHRGRLNMLVNILGKAPEELFAEFEGKRTIANGAGDVKYHMGFSASVQTKTAPIHLALAFNPSHLEIVNPVVEGSVRARLERRRKEVDRLPFNEVLPVLIHGDAAFAGQGVVMETLQLSGVRGYRCGGTVHIVINNQIGFTTSNPLDTRSALYCTDVAKMIQAPIFHVNGDDPETAKFIMQLALDYRQTFGKDVVVDLVCYRRLGHNEADEPSATQPVMYKKIRAHDTPATVYAKTLIAQGVITQAEYDEYRQAYKARLEEGKSVGFPQLPLMGTKYVAEWQRFNLGNQSGDYGTERMKVPETKVSIETIKRLSERLNQLPAGLVLHSRVQKIHDDRHKMGMGGLSIDWGFAETLAYASLLDEGYPVRISGQDCGRGTFFHRHAVYHNQVDGASYTPLANLSPTQPSFVVIDSILSEEAVLGFEYGYATAEPNALVIWEAQFGDFVNGAQVLIDQFISSGETKWGRLCGLVLLLPHGYEGQGPEHSSARPERFLQLCSEQNMSVVVPTTPAQCFHMLRRQMLQDYRKPLICMSPKSLLRHKLAVNSLEELSMGQFLPVIPEIDKLEAKKVERIIISVGRVYYDLYEARADKNNIALVRLEEIYPFPEAAISDIFKAYPHAKDIVFCQDEPKNQGYWFFVRDYLEVLLPKGAKLRFVGRPNAASPAVGYNSVHIEQQKVLLAEALNVS